MTEEHGSNWIGPSFVDPRGANLMLRARLASGVVRTLSGRAARVRVAGPADCAAEGR